MARTLRDEIRQERPFRSLEQEAFLNVIRTSAVVADDFERMLRPFGVSTAQFNVLRILAGAGPDGLCRNDVRSRMLTRMPDMTRLLDRMEAVGLVARTRETEDRRMVMTRITEKGRELLGELDEVVAQEHKRRFRTLSPEQLRMLSDLLTAVRE